HASESIIIAVRPAQDKAPGSASAEVHFAGEHRHVPRSPPMRHVFGFGDGLEDELARRVEDAGDEDLPIRGHRKCRGIAAGHIDFSFPRLPASLSMDSFHPPTRRSILQAGELKFFCPPHCIICSCYFLAFPHSSRRASKMRVMTSSRPDTLVAGSFFLAAMLFLLIFQLTVLQLAQIVV